MNVADNDSIPKPRSGCQAEEFIYQCLRMNTNFVDKSKSGWNIFMLHPHRMFIKFIQVSLQELADNFLVIGALYGLPTDHFKVSLSLETLFSIKLKSDTNFLLRQ